MSTESYEAPAEPRWRRAWPVCLLIIFVALGLVRYLPGGYGRAIVALPVALFVPGALTLGLLIGRRRIDAMAFSVLSALLSVLWFCFASLILYALHVLITAGSTFFCLLAICAVLAAGAQYRLITTDAESVDRSADYPVSPLEDERSRGFRSVGYSLVALIAGIALLAGGTYAYLHGPHPKAAGYTWIAWSGKQVTSTVEVGPAGTTLPFQIDHQEGATGEYQLTAAWTGTGTGTAASHALAKPVVMKLGPWRGMSGKLAIPVPPGGCTYRVVVTLTQLKQQHPKTWSINVDVRQREAKVNACAR